MSKVRDSAAKARQKAGRPLLMREIAAETVNLDTKNAKCFNRLGTYECRCKTGSSSPSPAFAEGRLPRNDQHLLAMLQNY